MSVWTDDPASPRGCYKRMDVHCGQLSMVNRQWSVASSGVVVPASTNVGMSELSMFGTIGKWEGKRHGFSVTVRHWTQPGRTYTRHGTDCK